MNSAFARLITTAGLMIASSASAQTPLKAGIADPVNTVLAWWMAEDGGF